MASRQPGTSTVTVTLEPEQGGTRVRLTHDGLTAEQGEARGHGWPHFIERLAAAGGRAPRTRPDAAARRRRVGSPLRRRGQPRRVPARAPAGWAAVGGADAHRTRFDVDQLAEHRAGRWSARWLHRRHGHGERRPRRLDPPRRRPGATRPRRLAEFGPRGNGAPRPGELPVARDHLAVRADRDKTHPAARIQRPVGSNLVIEHKVRLSVSNGCREQQKGDGEGASHSDPQRITPRNGWHPGPRSSHARLSHPDFRALQLPISLHIIPDMDRRLPGPTCPGVPKSPLQDKPRGSRIAR